MERDFDALDVVVTGGAGALGSAVIGRLLERGAICHAPLRGAGDRDRLPSGPADRLHAVEGVDLTAERQVEEFYGALPGLWASIHCAGGFAMESIGDTRLELFEGLWKTNAVSCFLCCREAIRAIRRGGEAGGRLVNVAARPALDSATGGGMVAYAAAKSAVASLTGALAAEVASERIWVNAVAPSILDTPANRAAMPRADTGEWPRTTEVAELIAHLASPRNGSTRGAVIPAFGRT